jgi:hypothetical protein
VHLVDGETRRARRRDPGARDLGAEQPIARSEPPRWRAATRVNWPTASAGITSAASPITTAAATTRSASLLPNVSRTVAAPIERYVQSSTGLNGRSKATKKPRSRSFNSTNTPSAGPTSQGTTRRARQGKTTTTTPSTSPSNGSRTKEPGVRSHGRIGATKAAQTTSSATTVSTTVAAGCRSPTTTTRAGASRRCRHSHHTSRPNDSASSANATANSTPLTTIGTTPDAAISNATPCDAVTVLRHSRRGSGARSHGTTHPAAKNR